MSSDDRIHLKFHDLTQGDLLDSGESVGRRTKGRKPMVQQKSENAILPEASRKAWPKPEELPKGREGHSSKQKKEFN